MRPVSFFWAGHAQLHTRTRTRTHTHARHTLRRRNCPRVIVRKDCRIAKMSLSAEGESGAKSHRRSRAKQKTTPETVRDRAEMHGRRQREHDLKRRESTTHTRELLTDEKNKNNKLTNSISSARQMPNVLRKLEPTFVFARMEIEIRMTLKASPQNLPQINSTKSMKRSAR